MAQLAGALEILMFSGIARLQQDMNAHTQTVGRAMKNIESSVAMAKQALGALGIGIGLIGFGRMIKGALDAQDELAKLSQKINVSVEMLAGYQHAAGLAGVSNEALTKGFKTLSSQMFDSSMGLLESQRNFKLLGIEVKNTDGTLRNTEDVMIDVADRFAKMQDGATKSALAVKLFGKAGLDMIPMLNQGSAALAAQVAEGQRLNPVTAESARQAELFNDNMLRLGKSISTVGISILIDLLPHLSTLSDEMVRARNEGAGFWATMFEGAKSAMQSVMGWTAAGDLKAKTDEIAQAYQTLKEMQEGRFGPNNLPMAPAMIDQMKDRIALLVVERTKMLDIIAAVKSLETPKAQTRSAPSIPETAKAVADLDATYRGLLKSLEEKLNLEKESTEVEKLMFALDHLRADLYAKLTIAELVNLEAIAHGVDIKVAAKKAIEDETKALVDYATWLEKVKGELAAAIGEEDKKRGQAIRTMGDQITRMEEENKLIGLTNVEREIAIKLLDLEAQGVEKGSLAYETAATRLRAAMLAGAELRNAQEAQVEMWKSVESAGHQAFLSIFDTSKSVLERIRDMLKTHLIDILYQMTVKKWMFNFVANVSGAGVAQSVFPGMTSAGGGLGGIGNIASFGSNVMGMGGISSGYGAFATSGIGQSIGLSTATAAGYAAPVYEAGALVSAGSGTAAGGLTAAGSSIGMAIPYVAAAVAAYMIISGYLDKPETVQGSGDARINPDGTIGGGVGQLHGGYNPAAVMGAASQAVQNFGNTVEALGGTITQSFGLGIGQGGGGEYNVVADINGRQLADQAGLDSAGMQLAATRAILVGLQEAADFPDFIKKIFESINAATASGEQINATIAFAGAVKTLRDQLVETRTPTEIAAASIVKLNQELGASATSAELWKTQLVAAIDAGMSPAALAKWQALGTAIQTVADIAAQAAVTMNDASINDLVTARDAVWQAYDTEAASLNTLAESMTGFGKSLRDVQASISGGPLSPLGPMAQFAQEQAKFTDLARRAQLGDPEALQALGASAQSYLQSARGAYASGSQYTAIFDQVQAALGGAIGTADRTAANAATQISLMTAQVSELVGIRAGVQSLALAMLNFANVSSASNLSIGGNQVNLGVGAEWARSQIAQGNQRGVYDLLIANHISAASFDAMMGFNAGDSNIWARANGLPAFERGTDYVPRTGLALVHQGESITPAGGNTALLAKVEALTNEVRRLTAVVAAGDAANVSATDRVAQSQRDAAWRQEVQPRAA